VNQAAERAGPLSAETITAPEKNIMTFCARCFFSGDLTNPDAAAGALREEGYEVFRTPAPKAKLSDGLIEVRCEGLADDDSVVEMLRDVERIILPFGGERAAEWSEGREWIEEQRLTKEERKVMRDRLKDQLKRRIEELEKQDAAEG